MNRVVTFFFAFLVWYLTSILTWGKGSLESLIIAHAIFFSTSYLIPTLLYAAIADVLAAEFFPAKPISGFLLLALVGAIGFAVLFPFLGYLANNPSYVFKNPFLYLFQLGLPVLAVFATYVVAIIMRERSKRSPD